METDKQIENNTEISNISSDKSADIDKNVESVLHNNLQVPDNVIVQQLEGNSENTSENEKHIYDIVEMNAHFALRKKIYEEILAPELVNNEKDKRTHKQNVVNKLFEILKWQFTATYIFIVFMLLMITFKTKLSLNNTIIKYMFDFLKFYITTIVAELIAILFFIVKQVFDKSIVELFKNFDKDKK